MLLPPESSIRLGGGASFTIPGQRGIGFSDANGIGTNRGGGWKVADSDGESPWRINWGLVISSTTPVLFCNGWADGIGIPAPINQHPRLLWILRAVERLPASVHTCSMVLCDYITRICQSRLSTDRVTTIGHRIQSPDVKGNCMFSKSAQSDAFVELPIVRHFISRELCGFRSPIPPFSLFCRPSVLTSAFYV